MKGFLRLSGAIALSCLAIESAARAVGYSPKDWIKPYKREALQDIVSCGSQLKVAEERETLMTHAGYLGRTFALRTW